MTLLKPLGDAIVILPCSMKKPYSSSQSHQIFMKVSKRIQELILTSPFGICPREMEKTYPIQSYDVSTTGDWSQEEINIIGEVLKKYVADKKVLAHVAGGYRDVCEQFLDDCIYTCVNDKPTSLESMRNLREQIKNYPKISAQEKLIHGLRSLAIYQFGEGGEALIPNEIRVKGRYNKQLFFENEQLATLLMDNGLFSLSLKGGELLSKINSKWINIDFNLETNTIFSPGISEADPNIIPKDEVIILKDGNVIGVGKAVLNGEEMVRATSGVAVRVRHRVK